MDALSEGAGEGAGGGAPPSKNPLYDPRSLEFIESFGAHLSQADLIDKAGLQRASRAAQASHERFDHVLTKLGLISESDLTIQIASFLQIPLYDETKAPKEAILTDVVELNYIRRRQAAPLSADDDSVTIAVCDPLDASIPEALAYLLEKRIILTAIAPADFERLVSALYSDNASREANGEFDLREDGANELDLQRLRDLASEAPVIRLVNQIISKAVQAGASDIHLEPALESLLVRYRIDGVLRTAQSAPAGLQPAIASRIKIMSKLDISERRLPQDGRIKIAVRGVDIDFRISTIPTIFGESIVMRILDRRRVELDFDKLGFTASTISSLQTLMREPNGIILVTGPTGSGKTTTLYTALKEINSSEIKIFTVEDPIEYQLNGVNQVQVQPAIGMDFPHALRAILRQDPNIIMIGEIRDLETARIAIQSSLTGHLVLSTLHTNSASASITRLIDMGVESYLLASTLKGVLAQRLVRRLCPICAAPADDADVWIPQIPAALQEGPPQLKKPTGCEACDGIGYKGRCTIAEFLVVDRKIQQLIHEAASDRELENQGRANGMHLLHEDGFAKAWRGETSIEEVLREARVS